MEKDEKGTKGNWYTGQMARYPQGNPFAGFEGKRKADSNSCWGCRSAFEGQKVPKINRISAPIYDKGA